MDEQRLKKILEDYETPPSDENAKKRAANLALAEFDAHRKENENMPQGFSILRRLTGSSEHKARRTPMNKRLVYGGMATAMTVILVTGISVQQFMTGSYKSHDIYSATARPEPVVFQEGRPEAEKDDAAVATPEERQIASLENKRKQEYALRGRADNPVPGRKSQALMAPAAPPMAAYDMAQSGAAGNRAVAKSIAPYPGAIVVPYPVEEPYPYYQDEGRDQFADFAENPVKLVREEPVSTFSIDVDASSYAFIRRQINNGVMPQPDAVRIEEMINYFDYDYPLPETKEEPFRSTVTVAPSPWKEGNKLLHIGIRGYDIHTDTQPRSNLVFLLDTSGSMNSPDKLPLVVNSLKLLLESLKPDDTVAVVTYAGSAGTALEPTKVSEKHKIIAALDNLFAGGSTAGAQGIEQAYRLAEANFDKEAVNRVILATDGDFNVGISDPESLKEMIEDKRESGIFLSVLGFGQGNLNDHIMQELAQNGNGTAAYIDTLSEARKVLVEEATSTLFPIAKDVKIQVEFNPATVAEYRLIGYETRHLNREDFNNDAVDAGDIGAGHTVTAIYEITPVGAAGRVIDDSRYQQTVEAEQTKADTAFGDEYAFLKIRYKLPDQDTSKLITTPVTIANESALSGEIAWAAAVAGFGQLLKDGKYTGNFSYDDAIALAQQAKDEDPFGYRAEFIQLVRLARAAAAIQKK